MQIFPRGVLTAFPGGEIIHAKPTKFAVGIGAKMPAQHHITATEYALLGTLACIVLETMDYSPAQRLSGESYLPPQLIEQAQQALAAYGKRIPPCKAMMAGVAA